MKVLIQWATATAQDWFEYDIKNNGHARSLPRKAKPVGGEAIDNEPGWISAINVQGVIFDGFDHLGLEMFNGVLTVTAWCDDADDMPEDAFFGQVWTFQDLAPDPRIGGRLNTRQSLETYARHGSNAAAQGVPHKSFELLPKPPASQTLHGVWLDNARFQRHLDVRSERGWREWEK